MTENPVAALVWRTSGILGLQGYELEEQEEHCKQKATDPRNSPTWQVRLAVLHRGNGLMLVKTQENISERKSNSYISTR